MKYNTSMQWVATLVEMEAVVQNLNQEKKIGEPEGLLITKVHILHDT